MFAELVPAKVSLAAAVLLLLSFTSAWAQNETPVEGPSWDFSHGHLKVSDDGHSLLHADGTPFIWIGDTAWELFHRLSREEAERYLEKRRKQGFTVIQAVALSEREGLTTSNAYGHLPLENQDPARPAEREGPRNDYWDHVDWIVEKAAEKGLYIGLLPTWGSHVCPRWDDGAEQVFTEGNARAYGRWIGKRFQDRQNIVWINGGDRQPEWCSGIPIWESLARGIQTGDNGRHLMTYHTSGGSSSSQWFHEADWLDFNMYQSGHSKRYISSYKVIRKDWQRKPAKPALNAEPNYEDHPVNWDDNNGWFDEVDVRILAYWSVFSGAFGHTYGAQPIWQMWEEGIQPASPTRHSWQEVLDYPGAWDMLNLRRLLGSRPFETFEPDQRLIAFGQKKGRQHLQAGQGNGFAVVYVPAGTQFSVQLGRIGAEKVTAWWYNPRRGKARNLGKFSGEEIRSFDPPGEAQRGNDWILVLDDTRQQFAPPGKVDR